MYSNSSMAIYISMYSNNQVVRVRIDELQVVGGKVCGVANSKASIFQEVNGHTVCDVPVGPTVNMVATKNKTKRNTHKKQTVQRYRVTIPSVGILNPCAVGSSRIRLQCRV